MKNVQFISKLLKNPGITCAGFLIGFAVGVFFPLSFGLSFRYDLITPLIFVFFVLWLTDKLPDAVSNFLSAATVMLLFSSSLFALWRMGSHGVYEIFGLLPWFDSSGYYSEALRLLDGGIFTQISARRPVFPAFFSTLLFLTDRNLRLSLLILTFISGLSTWFLVREIKISEKNALLVSTTAAMLFFFYRKFIGAILADTIGYTLGVLSLLLLWNASSRQKLIPALLGLFCFVLGQSARPGAIFSIPLIIVWMFFYLKTDENRIKKAFLIVVTTVGGLLVNFLLVISLTPGVSSSYTNLSFQIYSLVNGGTGWQAIYQDHPEYFESGNESDASRQIYQLSWEVFQEKPYLTFEACKKAVSLFFSTAPDSAFSYLDATTTPREITLTTAPLEYILRLIAGVLFILLLPLKLLFRQDVKLSMLFYMNLGVILSLPVASPLDIENMRAYAVSIPGMVLGVGYAAYVLVTQWNPSPSIPSERNRAYPPAHVYGLTALLLTGILLIPLVIHFTTSSQKLTESFCPSGKKSMVTRISAGSTIHIGITPSDPFSIPYGRFLKDMDHFPDANIGQQMKNIPEGFVISQQNDNANGGYPRWMIGPGEIMQPLNKPMVYCGKEISTPEGFNYFLAESVNIY